MFQEESRTLAMQPRTSWAEAHPEPQQEAQPQVAHQLQAAREQQAVVSINTIQIHAMLHQDAVLLAVQVEHLTVLVRPTLRFHVQLLQTHMYARKLVVVVGVKKGDLI
jgi:hypothetical protein